jgi:hypothetical protein
MQSTLNPKQTDPHADPHDHVLVARIDEELSSLVPDAMRHPSGPPSQIASDFHAGAVPPVDTTFRPAVNNVRVQGRRPSISRRAVRALTAFLLAGSICVAAIASQSYGYVAKQMVAKWVPKLLLTSSLQENPGPSERPSPPAVQANAAQTAAPQPAPPAQTATEGVAPAAAPSPESAQLLQSMTRDLAAARQEIDQLKASQGQMSRDVAKTSEAKSSEAKTSQTKASSQAKVSSEQNPRPRISALPPRPAAAPARRPTPSYPPPQAAAAPALPPAAAPYVPRQPEPPPQATAYPQADPELSPPRPPMPVRTGSFTQ